MLCYKRILTFNVYFWILSLLIICNIGWGEMIVTPTYPTSAPKHISRALGTESLEYSISYFTPPVAINIISNRNKANYTTPEAATISFISAIIANDFDWWFDSFDEMRKADLLGPKKEEYNEMKNFELRETSEMYKSKVIKLDAFIRYKDYVLIDWTAYKADGTKAFKMLTPLKLDNGLWKVTADENVVIFFIFKWD